MEDVAVRLRSRAEDIARWLQEHAPDVEREQRHLDEGSSQRAYWHYGYLVALRDVIRLLGERDRELKKPPAPTAS